MKLRQIKPLPILALALVLALMWQLACDSPTKDIEPPEDKTYSLASALVKDQSRGPFGVSVALATAFKNGDFAENIFLAVDDNVLERDELLFDPFVFGHYFGDAESLLIGTHPFFISDSTFLAETLFVTVPGTPSITSITPTQKGPGDEVALQWDAAVDADGYLVAAVKADSLYQGVGWTEFVEKALTQTTINDSAFTRFNLQGGEPNPGTYYIFVYSFTGAPDSALTSEWLPSPLPFQLQNNVDEVDLEGNTGAVVVSEPRAIEVLAAP